MKLEDLHIKLFGYCLAVILLSGCHHSTNIRPTQLKDTTISSNLGKPLDTIAQVLLSHLKANEPVFNEIAARMKTKLSTSSINQNFITNIRWKKGEKIWMSMSIIGIEGARVVITRDSIKIMDKLNERYILKPISYIKEKTFIDLSFTDIEQLLLGQLIFTDLTAARYLESAATTTIHADGLRFLTTMIFDKSTKGLDTMMVTDKFNAQKVISTYSNYQPQLGCSFPMNRSLSITSGPQIFDMEMEMQSMEIKDRLDYPFSINPNYKIEN